MPLFKIFFINCLFLFFCINSSLSATYYVDATNGNDSNTGRSHLQAWRTLGKVNSSVSGIGDDVYLLCGETWNKQQITVDWAGTQSDKVTIGSYYMDGDESIVGVNRDGKPIIDGGQTYPAIGTFLGLVTISKPYVTVQDLDLRRSEQYGIKTTSAADYYTIQRCKINHTYWGSIYIGAGANYGTIEYNHCLDAARKMMIPISPWAGGIAFRHTKGTLCRYNIVDGSYGEAFGIGNDALVQYNVALNFNSVGFYFDGATDSEASYNLAVGTTDATYDFHNYGWNGRGYDVNIENDPKNNYNTKNIIIHHNIAINCNSGFRFSITNPNYYPDFVYVYNNTWIDCLYSLRIDNNKTLSANRHVFYKNNISYPKHADANHYVIFGDRKDGDLSNWDCDYNVWAVDSAPVQADIAGANDSTTDPQFPKKMWRGTINNINDFTTRDLVPTVGSLGAGIDLGDDYRLWIHPGSNFNTLNPDPKTGEPITISLSSPVAPSTWPMGAFNTGIDHLSCLLCPPKGVSASGPIKLD
jgi:hypothetical protein